MGCCGGPNLKKKYSIKEYIVSTIAVIAFGIIIYFFTK